MKTAIPQARQAGFTMIEVIMVMVVIGILAIIAIPKYLNIEESSRRAAYYSIKESLEGHGAQIYAACALAGKARYPSSTAILISGSGKAGDCMEEGMPDSGFSITALSSTQISIGIDGVTQSYIYEPTTGKVSGEYN